MSRIVAGRAGGRRLEIPSRGTRPTTDRVREALFNSLDARLDLDGLAVLDLYAGSGALGLEALSRGAASADLVEHDARAAAVIARNVTALGLPGARVHRRTVSAFLAGTPRPMDLVLADPPYAVAATEVAAVVDALAADGWTAPGAVVVLERPASAPPTHWPTGWGRWPDRRYGDTRLDVAQAPAGPRTDGGAEVDC